MNRILLVEDHQELRELIAYNLEKEGEYEILNAENANDALILLEDGDVDLILLDLMLPGLGGLEFLKIVKGNSRHTNLPVVIISAKNSEQDVVSGLKLGADDYLTKPFSMKVLVAKVETILRRMQTSEGKLFSYGDLSIDLEMHKVMAAGEEVTLTVKEFELLLLFIKKPRKVFNRNQLLNSIWGYESDSYTRTVDAHISSLRKKLGAAGKVIRSVPKVGYGLDV